MLVVRTTMLSYNERAYPLCEDNESRLAVLLALQACLRRPRSAPVYSAIDLRTHFSITSAIWSEFFSSIIM